MKYLLLILSSVTLIFSSVLIAEEKPLSPLTIEGAVTIDTTKAKALYDDGALFVDVRSSKDWAAGRIPDAVHIELKKVFNEHSLADEAAKNEIIIIYCNGEKCLRSSTASAKAVSWGFTKIHYYRDGFPAWKSAGYPTE